MDQQTKALYASACQKYLTIIISFSRPAKHAVSLSMETQKLGSAVDHLELPLEPATLTLHVL